MDIKRIGVVGAGTMGKGIAQTAAQSGREVSLYDVSGDLLAAALEQLAKTLDRLIEKDKMTEDRKQAILSRINPIDELAEMAGVDFVIEAVNEDYAVKAKLFGELDTLCPPGTVLASNTSSLSIAKIAATTQRPEKVIGMHFFNPVPVMELVEVVTGPATSQDTVKTTEALAVDLGKTPVRVADSPGFAVNRLLIPMINEACYALMDGVAKPEAIDKAMELGVGHPIGPLALADLIGLDVCLAIMESLHQGFGDPKYLPCPLLREMVDAGTLGRKTGNGFHAYGASKA